MIAIGTAKNVCLTRGAIPAQIAEPIACGRPFVRRNKYTLKSENPSARKSLRIWVETDTTMRACGSLVRMLAEGALPLDRALPLMAPLLDVLVYLQAPPRPTTHRDIKPANVLLTLGRDGRGTLVPKLADFGLAKAFGVIATPVTQPGQIFGTIKYMAPATGTTRAFIPAGTIQFQINGAHPASITTAPTANMTPQFIVLQAGAAFEGLSIDWWAMKIQGLTR